MAAFSWRAAKHLNPEAREARRRKFWAFWAAGGGAARRPVPYAATFRGPNVTFAAAARRPVPYAATFRGPNVTFAAAARRPVPYWWSGGGRV